MLEINIMDQYALEMIEKSKQEGVVFDEQGLTVGKDGKGIGRNYVLRQLQEAFKDIPGQLHIKDVTLIEGIDGQDAQERAGVMVRCYFTLAQYKPIK